MKDFDAIITLVQQHAPGCSIPTAITNIRLAAIDLCEKSRLWRWDDDFEVVANDTEGISTPYGSVLHELELVQFNGNDLIPTSTTWLDDNMRGWRRGLLTGTPQFVTQTEMNTIRLVPGEDGHVDVFAWLKPTQDADELPDFLIDNYAEVVAHGALARILLIKGQPFTDQTLAQGFGALFANKLDALSNKGQTGQQRARRRTRGSFF